MIPEAGVIQFMMDCRCCGHRTLVKLDLQGDYEAMLTNIQQKFAPFALIHCEHCDNIAAHDLVAVSREE